MNVLLTGGAGFIGSHSTERLLAEGHFVVCLDNLDEYYDPSLKQRNLESFRHHPRYQFVEGDIRDRALLDELFQLYHFDAVLHLAARTGVRLSVQKPTSYFDVNVNGTLALLEAMRRGGTNRLVMASSSSVYGNCEQVPFREDTRADQPRSPYAASKRAAEVLAYSYHSLYGFDITCLRFFTVYGPRQRPEMAISLFTEQLLNNTPITIFGDGTTARDYTFVDDAVNGISLALRHLKGYNLYNIGCSDPVTLQNLVRFLEEAVGQPARIAYQPMPRGDMEYTYADLTRARTQLGYEPTVGIAEGIRRFVEWYKMDYSVS